ncbi:MAG: sigma factor-like helix-turn-helix DNA-binding protein, partial [Acidimicrobiales bacterium]
AEDTVIESESRAEVREALARLPRRTAAVLVMRHGGMSYAEVATPSGSRSGTSGPCSAGRSRLSARR